MNKPYGLKTDYRKINIYAKGSISPRYLASTTWARNLREAREQYALANTNYAASDLIAYYA